MKIGLIGLGNLGTPVGINLLKAEYQLIVHDLNSAAADTLLTKGAIWAESPKAVAETSDVVITILPSPMLVM
jgi:3-hydroxyisobutyrate dehydrogenase-like beta-hydroxyacid dehydrogenase